jgi:60 kDa SS-A/Ro ribonucleoprotein
MKYRDIIGTPTQRERADERQVVNNAGGYVYEVDKQARLRRFLVLGTEGGTFYASQRDLTRENVRFLRAYATDAPAEVFSVLSEVNSGNVAPRHSTVLLALAVLHATGDKETNEAIKGQFGDFVRTGTHLFEFVDYALMARDGKWGRSLRSLVSSWYLAQEPDALAYQIVKYRQRGGTTHRDLLRLAHPKADGALNTVLNYATQGPVTVEDATKAGKPTSVNVDVAEVIKQFEEVKAGTLAPTDANVLTWEMLPTEALRDVQVWRALLASPRRMPFTAMLRNLGRMTSLGVFEDRMYVKLVTDRLRDAEAVKRARIHPFNALTALKTYQQGGGFRGSLTWLPVRQIVDALDGLFYLSFGAVPSTGKSTLLALDVSGSMTAPLMNSNVTAREGSAAMAMATLAADPDTTDIVGFTQDGWSLGGRSRLGGWASTIEELDLSPRQRMDDVIRVIRSKRMGGTDCALPILWASHMGRKYDTFVVYTDNETWAGNVQPMDALRTYRRNINPDARLVVVGMTSTGFTIADPQDAGTMDVVGFDASAPRLIADFAAGKF